ncbi:MAG: carboxypeptidase-like regulatory domain-containing protein, partial [Opitutaceae bacterium]|nr:carboxypeptidase-like regulatory domain-containing protein [Cytophagales bacterium]
MLIRYLCFVFFIFFAFQINAQDRFVLSGTVRDSANGEDMIGATIFVKETNSGVATNPYGFFSLTLPKGTYTVVISYVGYVSYNQIIEFNSNIKLDVALDEQRVETKEVIVTAERKDAQVKNLEMGVSKLEMKQISSIPPLLGEVDVIRSIQLLPGVSTVGEGASGFNVRGGGVDQNLILLDEAPVYNSSHLFGFFSVFNPDAVKDVKLSKSAIPAQYGGRLSSVLDVRMKEGNMKKVNVQGGVGVIFSRLTVEGPIKKDKASFIIAGRRSYADVLARPFLKGDFTKAKLYFYDLTAKTNYIINKNNRIFLSGYFGRDVFGATAATFSWGNSTASLRWNHLFSSKLFMNLTTYYSNYDYRLAFGRKGEDDSFEWTSRILNYSVKPDFTWFLNDKNTITFGAQAIYYTFKPSNGISVSKGKTRDISLPLKYGAETAIYLSNEQKLSARLSVSYGLRFSFFNYLGEGSAYSYSQTSGNYIRNPVSVQKYNSGETITSYANPEPRAAVNFSLSESSSFKASYNRMAQ